MKKIALLCFSCSKDESTIPVGNDFNSQEFSKSEEANKIAQPHTCQLVSAKQLLLTTQIIL